MKAFVTGGTGLLGSNLVAMLTSQGHDVKALARSKEKAAALIGDTGAQVVIGDMEDVDAFADELNGCDVLFHTAAYFRESFVMGDHWPTLKRINVDATIKLLTEAEKRGIKKVIYVSSSTVIGASANGSPSDETAPPDRVNLEQNLYRKSKIVAEEAIADFLKTHHLPVVLVLPTAIFGPRDAAPTNAGKLILDFLNRRVPVIPPGGFAVVDVRDVSQAMINAVERGKSGECYILNNTYYSVGDLLAVLSKITGVPAPNLRMPYAAAMVFAYTSEFGARLTGQEPVATVNAVRILNRQHNLSANKAKRELGVTFRPFEQTLRDSVAWYIERNYPGLANLQLLAQM
jgi:dihydroflavonol-4-reductase